MNKFVLKNTFIKVYIYHFSIKFFIETRSQSCVLKTVSLSKTTFFTSTERVVRVYSVQYLCNLFKVNAHHIGLHLRCFGVTPSYSRGHKASLNGVSSEFHRH
jgi:hypothetical protein